MGPQSYPRFGSAAPPMAAKSPVQPIAPGPEPVAREPMPVMAPSAPITLRGDKTAVTASIDLRIITYERVDKWCKLVGNRRFWADAGIDAETMLRDCTELMHNLGVNDEALRELSAGDYLEVAIPFGSEETSRLARCFPWEYVLVTATKPARGDRPISVVRHLQVTEHTAPYEIKPPKTFAFIETAPKPFDQFYGFSAERDLLHHALEGVKGKDFYNPTRRQLESLIKEADWDVIHLTGLDRHQGVSLLRWKGWERDSDLVKNYAKESAPADGVIVLNDKMQLDFLDSQALGETLTLREAKPLLVTMNLYHSAGSLAALAVAHGASAAIGFQDTFDDSLCDTFFSRFYRACAVAKWDILPAFAWTVSSLPRPAMTGTGIVLWSKTTLLKVKE
ncbi:MAG: hypothetical protein HYX68_29140 [Planctomycetes bacterium]|nr:hypothetical protein [Planctomycetota bacterium]